MEAKDIPLNQLAIDSMNVRQHPYPLGDLENSIEKHGILDPLLVRPQGKSRFNVVCGSMRFRVAQTLDMKIAPCVIRELSDEEALVLSLTENIQRGNLSLDEEADGVAKLYEISGSQREVAEAIGKSQKWVQDHLASKGIIDVFKEVYKPADEHATQTSLPRDITKVSSIASMAKSLFPEKKEKQAELFDVLKDKDRREVRRASTYLRAKVEEEPTVFEKKAVREVVEDAFKVVNVQVSVRFASKVSHGLIRCAEDRGISWEDVVDIAVEQWLKREGYLG